MSNLKNAKKAIDLERILITAKNFLKHFQNDPDREIRIIEMNSNTCSFRIAHGDYDLRWAKPFFIDYFTKVIEETQIEIDELLK